MSRGDFGFAGLVQLNNKVFSSSCKAGDKFRVTLNAEFDSITLEKPVTLRQGDDAWISGWEVGEIFESD